MGKIIKLGMKKRADEEIFDFIIELAPSPFSIQDDIAEEAMLEWAFNIVTADPDFDPDMWKDDIMAAADGFLDIIGDKAFGEELYNLIKVHQQDMQGR